MMYRCWNIRGLRPWHQALEMARWQASKSRRWTGQTFPTGTILMFIIPYCRTTNFPFRCRKIDPRNSSRLRLHFPIVIPPQLFSVADYDIYDNRPRLPPALQTFCLVPRVPLDWIYCMSRQSLELISYLQDVRSSIATTTILMIGILCRYMAFRVAPEKPGAYHQKILGLSGPRSGCHTNPVSGTLESIASDMIRIGQRCNRVP